MIQRKIDDSDIIRSLAECAARDDRITLLGTGKQLGCTPTTIRRRLMDDAFRARLAETNPDLVPLVQRCLENLVKHGNAYHRANDHVPLSRDGLRQLAMQPIGESCASVT